MPAYGERSGPARCRSATSGRSIPTATAGIVDPPIRSAAPLDLVALVERPSPRRRAPRRSRARSSLGTDRLQRAERQPSASGSSARRQARTKRRVVTIGDSSRLPMRKLSDRRTATSSSWTPASVSNDDAVPVSLDRQPVDLSPDLRQLLRRGARARLACATASPRPSSPRPAARRRAAPAWRRLDEPFVVRRASALAVGETVGSASQRASHLRPRPVEHRRRPRAGASPRARRTARTMNWYVSASGWVGDPLEQRLVVDGAPLDLGLADRPLRAVPRRAATSPQSARNVSSDATGEEAQVGLVEDPAPLVVEVAAEQRQPDVGVGDVGDREQHLAVRAQVLDAGRRAPAAGRGGARARRRR